MVKVIYDTSEEAQTREAIRIREKSLHDFASEKAAERRIGIAIGEARGIAISEARGIEKKRQSLIRNMRACGKSEEYIREILNYFDRD